ncbi:hypothetical protein ACHAXR_013440 [Thalassiosira sp. AJA248-18]
MEKRQRQILLLASRSTIVAIAFQLLLPYLLPHGPAVDIPPQHRPVSSVVDPNNTSLRLSGGKLTKIYERVDEGNKQPLLVKPETIVFDNRGVMYIMNENAQLVSLTDFEQVDDRATTDSNSASIVTAKTTEVAHLGPGRPLGGKFDNKGCLYFADVIVGLARICDIPSESSKTQSSSSNNRPNVEILASRVKLEDGSWSPIMYADDVDIGPKTGHIYFSDATDVKTDRDVTTGMWDIMYSSKLEGIRGKMTGRLLRYQPETGEVDILATGAAFANGVAVDKDETFVLYTSTLEGCVMKYHLTGEREGPERLLDGFPGLLDGADCSFEERGLCYVAIPTTIPPLAAAIFSMPSWIGRPIRSFLMMIPRSWTPKPQHYGAFAEILPGSDNTNARILRLFQDPSGRDAEFVTGVTAYEGKLYLGSLHNNYVGVVSLD